MSFILSRPTDVNAAIHLDHRPSNVVAAWVREEDIGLGDFRRLADVSMEGYRAEAPALSLVA
jgi:hypothetical protein